MHFHLYIQLMDDDLHEVTRTPFVTPIYWDVNNHSLKLSKDLMKVTVDANLSLEEYKKQVEAEQVGN